VKTVLHIFLSLAIAAIALLEFTSITEAMLTPAIDAPELVARSEVSHWSSHIAGTIADHPDDLQLQRQAILIQNALTQISDKLTREEVRLELDRLLSESIVTGQNKIERDEVRLWLAKGAVGARLSAFLEERITRPDDDSERLIDAVTLR